ncbi:MAG TPA: hypothetical protein VET48_06470, partial [Steroidobacteraceae bacterium]|nr:hypothetical protein [Steroidobacteraceae bacterium]
YDGQGRVIQVTEPNNRVTQTSYDNGGRATDVAIDPSGLNLRTHYTFDDEDRTLTVTAGYQSSTPLTTKYVYDTLGRRTDTYVDPNGLNLHTQYKFDDDGIVRRIIDANGQSTWFVYDNANRLINTINQVGDVTELHYDGESHLISTRRITKALDATTIQNLPDVVKTAIRSTDSSDTVLQSVFDKDGRVAYSIDGAGGVTEFSYNDLGEVTHSRSYVHAIAPGTYTTLTQVKNALAAAGNNLTTIDPSDAVAYSLFDERGRKVFTVSGTGSVAQMQYDGDGNVIALTRYATTFNLANPVTLSALRSFATANGGNTQNEVTSFAYDAADRLCVTTDGVGIKTYALHDALSRVVATIDGVGALTEFVYDSLSRVVKTIRYATALTTSQLASLIGTNGKPANVSLASIRPTSSTADQVTRQVFNDAGQLIYTIASADIDTTGKWFNDITQRQYDSAGRLIGTTQLATQLILPSSVGELRLGTSNATTTQLIDSSNPAASYTVTNVDPQGNDRRTRLFYDNDGQVIGTLDAAGYLRTNSFDTGNELTQSTVYAKAVDASLRQNGTLDQLQSSAALDNGTELGGNTYLFYDGQGRQIGSVDAEGYLSETQYLFTTAGQVVQTLRYDPDENTGARRVLSVTPGTTFQTLKASAMSAPTLTTHMQQLQYDGVGRLSQERNFEGTVTAYQYNNASQLIATTSAQGTNDERKTHIRYDVFGRVSQTLSRE